MEIEIAQALPGVDPSAHPVDLADGKAARGDASLLVHRHKMAGLFGEHPFEEFDRLVGIAFGDRIVLAHGIASNFGKPIPFPAEEQQG